MKKGKRSSKKPRAWALIAGLLLVLFLPLASFESSLAIDVTVVVNGQLLELDVAPVISEGRTLLPLRAIAEALGAEVGYDNATKTVSIHKYTSQITLTLNKKECTVDGAQKQLDVPATAVNGRTLVPLRFVGESLGAGVEWVSASKQVKITGASYVTPPSAAEEKIAQEMLSLINSQRTANGLSKLVMVDSLNDLARNHAWDMKKNKFFSHTSPSYGDAQARAQNNGLWGMNENIASGYPDAQSVMEAWFNSSGHYANLMGKDLCFIGLGVCKTYDTGTAGIYFVSETMSGEGFFVCDRDASYSGLTGITLKGYALNADVPIVVYQLDPEDQSIYTSRREVAVTNLAADYSFETEIELWASGVFAVCIGDDYLQVDNR